MEKKTSYKKETKEDIIEAASHLFSEYTYLGTSMSDIAKKLSITKAALYYHFKSKAEIYKKVLDKIFTELMSTIEDALSEKTTDTKLSKLIINYLEFGMREKNLVRALMLKIPPRKSEINKHIAYLKKQIVDLIEPLIKEVVSSKKDIKKIDNHLIISLFTSMMDGLILEYSFLDKKIDSKKISNHIIAILF